MTDSISNFEDMIDSRDVIERIEELQNQDWGLDDDEQEELVALMAFAREGEDVANEWEDGTALIRNTYFVEYVEDNAQEMFEIPSHLEQYIDFEKMAADWKQDYSEVTFDGVDFYVQNC